MGRSGKICAALIAVCSTVALVHVGCEDVLDVCSPCGSLVSGDVTISGDPRLDGTFEAVQEIRRRVDQIRVAYEQGRDELKDAFELSPDDSHADLVAAIDQQLLSDPEIQTTIMWEPARCHADRSLAVNRERACEERLDHCNITTRCREAPMATTCTGLYMGQCVSPVGGAGTCFVEPSEDISCQETCMGACNLMVTAPCPGLCHGSCSGPCTSYDASGQCSGYCRGACSGTCEATSPFVCNGTCSGRCAADLGQTECPEDGVFVGSCKGDLGHGECRGHIRPAGCDEQCSDCREMAKALAWSAMVCLPATVRVGVALPDSFPDRESVIEKARTLERVLTGIAGDHGWLSLLVDGMDDAGGLLPADLVEEDIDQISILAYLEEEEDLDTLDELGVAVERRYLPLENLKARIAWLSYTATKKEGGYVVSASGISCLEPALEQALGLLDQMIPKERDRRCASLRESERESPDLYRLLACQADLIDLIQTTE